MARARSWIASSEAFTHAKNFLVIEFSITTQRTFNRAINRHFAAIDHP